MSQENTSFEYVITQFDAVDKLLRVEFADGGWAQIPLMAPLPTDMAEVDAIVRQFTAPVEVMAARAAATDLSFLSAQLMTPRTTERLKLTPEPVVTPTPSTLAEWKEAKKAEIAEWRWQRETGGVTVGGARIKTDRESQATINGAYTSLKGGLLESVRWKTDDGTFITMGLAEIEAVAQAVALHVQQSFDLEAQLVELVNQAETIEAVQAIEPGTIYPV